MKLRNAYYLQYIINTNSGDIVEGSMVTFSTSVEGAKRDIKLGHHRPKGTRFKFTNIECFGENISVHEYIRLAKEKNFKIYRIIR